MPARLCALRTAARRLKILAGSQCHHPNLQLWPFLGKAIRSVLEKAFQDFELNVVDDGSTDNTRQSVAQFESDARVRYVFRINQGDAAERNAGIAQSVGRYLAFLDSDDYWMPEKLDRQMEMIRSNSNACAVHYAVYKDHVNCQHRLISWRIVRRSPLQENKAFEQQLYGNIITGSHSSVLLSRDVLN